MFRAMAFIAALMLLLAPAVSGQIRPENNPPRRGPRIPDSPSIRGKLIPSDPRGLSERVEVRLEANGFQLIQVQYSDTAGNFEFRNVPRGQYFIVVRLDGYEDVRERVEVYGGVVGATNVIIMMNAAPSARRSGGSDGDPDVVDITELQNYPRQAVQEYERGLDEERNGDLDRAIQHLEEAVRVAPDFYQAHFSLGSVYQKLARFRDAEDAYRRARQINPRSAQPLINLGSLFIQESDSRQDEGFQVVGKILDDALDALEEAVRISPLSAAAHYYLGAANLKSSFHEEAEAALTRALELNSAMSPARLMLANVYIQQGRWDDVIEQLDTYLEENPESADRVMVEQTRAKILEEIEASEQ